MNFKYDQDFIDALTLSLSLLANIIERKETFDDENTAAQVKFARTLVRWAIKRKAELVS